MHVILRKRQESRQVGRPIDIPKKARLGPAHAGSPQPRTSSLHDRLASPGDAFEKAGDRLAKPDQDKAAVLRRTHDGVVALTKCACGSAHVIRGQGRTISADEQQRPGRAMRLEGMQHPAAEVATALGMALDLRVLVQRPKESMLRVWRAPQRDAADARLQGRGQRTPGEPSLEAS